MKRLSNDEFVARVKEKFGIDGVNKNHFHDITKEKMALGKVFAIPNAGYAIFKINRQEALDKLK